MSKTVWIIAAVIVAVSSIIILSNRSLNGPVRVATLSRQSVGPQPVQYSPSPGLTASAPKTLDRVPTTVTEAHTQLFNSLDVLAAVRLARAGGTPDQKGWAGELFKACAMYAIVEKLPDGDHSEGHIEQQAAFAELQRRCAGLRTMSRAEWHALTDELQAAAAQSTSTYHTLRTLYDRADTRWNVEEQQAIAANLHGSDPLLRKYAFLSLLQGIDQYAPGGEERHQALFFAMNGEILNPITNEFTRLSTCATLPGCEYPGGPGPHVDERLRMLYVAAFAKRMSPQEILAIH